MKKNIRDLLIISTACIWGDGIKDLWTTLLFLLFVAITMNPQFLLYNFQIILLALHDKVSSVWQLFYQCGSENRNYARADLSVFRCYIAYAHHHCLIITLSILYVYRQNKTVGMAVTLFEISQQTHICCLNRS